MTLALTDLAHASSAMFEKSELGLYSGEASLKHHVRSALEQDALRVERVLDDPLEMFIRRPSAANRNGDGPVIDRGHDGAAAWCKRGTENGLSRAVDNGGYFGQPHPRKL